MARPAFSISSSSPGSDLAAETAAALAAASMFYENIGESAMASEALSHAVDLFELADSHRGTYVDSIPAGSFYKYNIL